MALLDLKSTPAPLSSYLMADEAECLRDILRTLDWDANFAAQVEKVAKHFVTRVRAQKRAPMQLESFLQEYSLSTPEGLSLMCLAEALLRIPDAATAQALIKDKVVAADWLERSGNSKDWVVKAAGLGLVMTSRTLDSALARIGEPFIRQAMVKAMRMIGKQFVLGTHISNAVSNAEEYRRAGYRMSYDMLGEAARTEEDAQRYFRSYIHAIEYIAQHESAPGAVRPGISVKLSALHPRYEFAQKEVCVPALADRLLVLCKLAAQHNLSLTVDAEESERLEMSLQIMQPVFADPDLRDWDGFGIAVQAYQKRALVLIDHLHALANRSKRRIQVRLVKGAYWDSEIKRAQELGLEDYPVFTRKCNTDASYLACAAKLLQYKGTIYPMFGTHNAHSAAAVIMMAREYGQPDYELQRLHGMGEALFEVLIRETGAAASIYAPVGPHEDLLAYLVRRLLENGANSSFVNQILDPAVPVDDVVVDPVARASEEGTGRRHAKIAVPADLYGAEKPVGRKNSHGIDLNDEASVSSLLEDMRRFERPYDMTPIIGGKHYKESAALELRNPSRHVDNLGMWWPAHLGMAKKAVRVAAEGFARWNDMPSEIRAQALEDYAALLEANAGEMMALLVREAGKTIADAHGELREAVDFCRYYANLGRADFFYGGREMPGVTGERNIYRQRGRGVFVCISPWNFPLAIFTGQIAAALMAGNSVVAKPAEQAPLIAYRAVQLMHKAGIPTDVLQFMPGDGDIGSALVANPDVAGVVFTGSTEVAKYINLTLAQKDGPIVPFIAETGGLNAMIVDSSALPEQVVDDVIVSAFGSAGQRCSALRILCVQEDIADTVLEMLRGAMAQLRVGPPGTLASDLGPVIDEEARGNLVRHREELRGYAKLVYEVELERELKDSGHYFGPCVFELPDLDMLDREVFGPILHVVRYKKSTLDGLIDDLNAKGYGLTLGVHSRIDGFAADMARRVRAGNVYVNRSMIGAVVGSQPFGGQGLSGSGPKAGGPAYLQRFATEEVVSINTTAAGGNASLVCLED